jgi:hypothetical protein
MRTSTILVTEVRKPPDIPQSNTKTNTGQQEVDLSGPGFSLFDPIIFG